MIEIPKARGSINSKWGSIFRKCKNQGDNFFIPFEVKTPASFSATVYRWNKALAPWHFVTRTKDSKGNEESKDGKKGFRVWRDK